MEERQDNTKNIKLMRQRLKDEKVKGLLTDAKKVQSQVGSISKLLSEKENELRKKAVEEVAVVETATEEVVAPVKEVEQPEAPIVEEKKAKKTETKAKKEKVEKDASKQPVATEVAVEPQPSNVEVAPVIEQPIVENKIEKPSKKEEKTEAVVTAPEVSAPAKTEESEPETPAEPPKKSILSFIVKKADPKAEQQKREERKPQKEKNERPQGDRNDRNNNRPPRQGDKPTGAKPGAGYKGSTAPTTSFGNSRPMPKHAQEIAFVPPKDNKPVKKKAEKSRNSFPLAAQWISAQ